MVQLTGASKNPAAKEKIARKQNEFFNFAMAPGLFATVLKRVDGSYSMPFVSEGVRELYGLDPEDVMRDIKLFTALVHPDDIAMIFRKADESARDLTPYSVEYRINHPDKGMRWIENSSMPQRLPDGGTRWDGFFHDITGRKRLEQELKLKELVIEHAHDALYLMDQENFVYANEAACRSLGYSRDELLALTLKDIDPDFSAAEEKQAALNKLLEEGSIIHETRHYRRDGSSFPVEIQASLFDYQGKSLVLSVARDITERKRMEQALIDSEQKFRSLAENVPDNIARWDTETRYIYVNSVCERTLDSPAAKVIGKTIKEAFPDGRFAQIATGIAQIVATGKTITVVRQPAQFANGERQLHDVKMVPERDAAGKIIGVLGIGRDMTGFYRLQDELEAKEKELRVLAESTPGMMGSFYARPDGSICMPYVSPNIEKLFGLRPQDMAVDASALLALNHPEDAERVRESIAESARTMTTWHEEYRILHPTLGERWIESNTMPQPHPDGGIVWYGYVHDITQRKSLENEMIASEAQLRSRSDLLHAILESSPDMITFALDQSYRYIAFNSQHKDTMQSIWGKEITLGLNMLGVIGDHSDHNAAKKCFDRALAGECFTLEEAYGDERLTRQYWQNHYAPIYSAEGNVVGMTCFVLNITERKRLEEAIAAREQEFRSLAESSPDFIIRVNRDLRIRYLNANMVKFLELGSAQEVIGRQAIEIWPDGRFNEIDAARERVVTTGEMLSFEVTVPTAEGKIAYHHIVTVPERDTDDHIIGTLGFGRDITAIRETEQRLNSLVQNLPGIAFTLRLSPQGEFNFTYVSAGVEEMYGITPEAAMGDFTAMHGLIHPDDKPGMEAAVAESARELSPYRVEARIYPPGQPERWLDVRADPQSQPDGSILWFGFIFDITERKRHEDELRLAAAVYENSSEGMLITDADAKIVAINPAFTELTGYRIDDVVGKTPRMFQSGRQSKEFYQDMWNQLKNQGQWQGELWNRRKDGNIYAGHLNINAEKNTDGSIHRYIALFSDITDKKKKDELIWKQASYDSLTGLPNRRLFHDRLEQEAKMSLRTASSMGLLFIDLDRFKEVNDTLGHAKGDALLIEVTKRIRKCVRETDTVARLGGDEFTVIVPDVTEAINLDRIVQNILHELATPFDLGEGDQGHISASIGIALFPDNTNKLEELMQFADQAMYEAKLSGRNRAGYFKSSAQTNAQEKMSLKNEK